MITAPTPAAPRRKVGILEFIGKHKATVEAVTVLAEKVGQKNIKPAVDLKFKVTVPNAKLHELDPTLYGFCFHNSGRNSGTLEGIQVVSGEPNLTPAFVKMGAQLGWQYEQTGCTLKVYQGPGAKPKLTLKDCTVKKLTIDGHEGGSTDWFFHVYSADVDEDVMGQLGVLKALDRDIELEAPDLVSAQKDLTEEDDDNPEAAMQRAHGASVTPIKAGGTKH